MKPSTIFSSLAGVTVALAAPTWPMIDPASFNNGGLEQISAYFNILAEKIAQHHSANSFIIPTCDLSKAVLPQAPTEPLEAPSKGLVLKHVAIGRGTQNYTCDTSNPSSAPVANGALATLFNASCLAATYPDVLSRISGMALQFGLGSAPASGDQSVRLGPTNLLVSGRHLFLDGKTPYFNLDTDRFGDIGYATFSKKSATDAPSDAPKGLLGEKAVPWLKLVAGGSETAELEATGGLEEVYRVGTAGGSPPTTCEGMPPSIEVQYTAEYWFYAKE